MTNILSQDKTPLGYEFQTAKLEPEAISLVPILRSGLGMVEGKPLLLYPFQDQSG